MKKEVVSKEVYISDDGVTFDSEKDCKKHEEALQRIQYFRARTNPDLTESGCTTASVLFAVKCCLGFQKAYCIQWLMKNKGNMIAYVQGSPTGYCFNWTMPELIPKVLWDDDKRSEKVYIYDTDKVEIEGFPEPVCGMFLSL